MPRLLGQLLEWLAQPSDDGLPEQPSWPTPGSHTWGKPWQGADALAAATLPPRRHRQHLTPVSFKDKPKLPKCLCPTVGHCVPGDQCPKGEHVDPSKCFKTIEVRFPPDPEYVRCLRMKESDPGKECELRMLKMPNGLKMGQLGLPFFEGSDSMIVKRVGGTAESQGIRRGMQLVSIDGNFAWKEKGLDYLKELDWSEPPLQQASTFQRRMYGQPRGTPQDTVGQEEGFNVEQEPGDNCKGQPGSSEPPPPPPGSDEGQPGQTQKVLPCYPNGHKLSFKMRIPRYKRRGQLSGNCPSSQICCAMGANRTERKGIFQEVCPSKSVCRPSETCTQAKGRQGICKYQVEELKEDHEDDEKDDDDQDEAEEQEGKQEDQKEMQREQDEEKPKGVSFF